jgi:hypothetical protein
MKLSTLDLSCKGRDKSVTGLLAPILARAA